MQFTVRETEGEKGKREQDGRGVYEGGCALFTAGLAASKQDKAPFSACGCCFDQTSMTTRKSAGKGQARESGFPILARANIC